LDNHLSDDLCVDGLLISDDRVLETFGLPSLDFFFKTELVFETLPSPIHGAGHLVSVLYFVRVVRAQISSSRGG